MQHLITRSFFISLFFSITTWALAQGFQPSPGNQWSDYFCVGGELCEVGDVNGDGMDDIIALTHQEDNASVWVGLSNGSSFISPQAPATDWFCVKSEVCRVGDVNGDGRSDLVAFSYQQTNGAVWVGLANNDGTFATGEIWHNIFCLPSEECLVGDMNGDGMDDLVALGTFMGNTNAWVALSQGNSFGQAQLWSDSVMCDSPSTCELADVNGDGMDDIVKIYQSDVPIPADGGVSFSAGSVFVNISTGSSFEGEGTAWWHDGFCTFLEAVCTTGDFDGDKRADIIMFLRDSAPNLIGFDQRQGRVDVAFSDGTAFVDYASQHDLMCIGEEFCAVGDFDGDGKDDIVAFVKDTKTEPGRGDVWVANSVLEPSNPTLVLIPILLPTSTPATLTINPNIIAALSGLDLVVGDTVMITPEGDNLNMRSGPGPNFQVVEVLPQSNVMIILEGPIDSDGYRWWRVTHYGEPTAEGWIAEGDGNENWLVEVQF